jgi:acyl-CoA synthetase (AMP-forming)/AMP-acid ligase II
VSNVLEKALKETVNNAALLEFISQFDGRFPVCFVDSKNNMIPLKKENISLRAVNILLDDHTHIKDVYAIVIKHPKEKQ